MGIRLVIVDDDHFITGSLKTILTAKQFEVLALGSTGEDAVRLYREYQPDILLSDIQMPGMNGLEAARQILQEFPGAKILFLTTFSDDAYIVSALSTGAKGYIMKQDFEGICPALLAVQEGQTVFGGMIASKLSEVLAGSGTSSANSSSVGENSGQTFQKMTAEEMMVAYGLTQKELELLQYISQGMNNKEIADRMYFSEGTVRNYISILLDKLQLRDRTQLAVFFLRHSN